MLLCLKGICQSVCSQWNFAYPMAYLCSWSEERAHPSCHCSMTAGPAQALEKQLSLQHPWGHSAVNTGFSNKSLVPSPEEKKNILPVLGKRRKAERRASRSTCPGVIYHVGKADTAWVVWEHSHMPGCRRQLLCPVCSWYLAPEHPDSVKLPGDVVFQE